MGKHTYKELQQWQYMNLDLKIAMTKARIREWANEYGSDGVYVSFSGGKDSTVLLDLVRSGYPDVPAVFVDTGLEYPEIREFVKTFDNVEWLKPKKTFRQVIEEYGYPFISKRVSDYVQGARKYKKDIESGRNNPPTERYKCLMNTSTKKDGSLSSFNISRYQFFLDAPFEISAKCCDVMKKAPMHTFANKTHRNPITAQMASESRLRTTQWLKNGCNGFHMTSPISNPMSFWTEQDVLLYIKRNNLPICSVYGDIVADDEKEGQIEGQISIEEMIPFGMDRPLKTTGCKRTGCMFCGYGCHLEKEGEGRFEMMKKTHPKQYDYIMRPKEQGGLNYKEVIDWINEHGDMRIRY